MDGREAIEESPIFKPPATDAPQLVGGAETTEFLRQADAYCDRYGSDTREMERYDVPDADHFHELNRPAEDDSGFFEKSMALLSRRS